MNEIMTGGQPARTLETVTQEIRYLDAQAKRLVLGHAIEIGRRLTEAKALVPYGEWGQYIERELEYSQSTAQNFIRIFDEYGAAQQSLFGPIAESQTLGKLSYTKALALLAVPREEREAFAAEVDAEHISSRELQAAIRERDEARKRAESAEDMLRAVNRDFDLSQEAIKEREARLQEQEGDIRALSREVQELKARPVEVAVQEPDPAEVERRAGELAEKAKTEAEKKAAAALKAEQKAKETAQRMAEDLRKKLDAAEKKLKAAEDKASDAGDGEAARAEIAFLKKQLAMSDAATAAARVHFTAWQEAYRKLREAVEAAPETAREKLLAAIRAQAEAWAEEAGA